MSVIASPPVRASLIKGSSALVAARIVTMASGLLLFLLLTWRSREAAGVFRTAFTYFTLMDALPLLGMHWWLSTEMARDHRRRSDIFSLCATFAGLLGLVFGVGYFAMAKAAIYPAGISLGLTIVSFSTVASALNLCALMALIGMGHSQASGLIGFFESLSRTLIAIVIVASKLDVSWILVDFVAVRIVAAASGLWLVRSYVPALRWHWSADIFRAFKGQIPNLALSMLGSVVTRNIAMIVLPRLHGEAEAGVYAVAFQLFDSLLMVPTMLAVSANNVLAESTRISPSHFRRSVLQLFLIVGFLVFPLAATAIAIARPGIEFLFGHTYGPSVPPFQILMIAVMAASFEQVLSITMVSAGRYKADRMSSTVGAGVTLLATLALVEPLGATGAALALMVGMISALIVRLWLLRSLIPIASLAMVARALIAPSLVSAAAAGLAFQLLDKQCAAPRFVGLATSTLVGLGLAVVFCAVGGLNRRHLRRAKRFLGQRG